MSANKKGLVSAFKKVYDWESALMKACVGRGYPKKKAFNNFGKCMSSWGDLFVADRRFDKAYFSRKKIDWKAMSKNMDTMIASYFAQITFCNARAKYYNLYATLTKRNFRKCSDAHTNFFKDARDLCKDLNNGFRGASMYFALMDASEMMRDVEVSKKTCRP